MSLREDFEDQSETVAGSYRDPSGQVVKWRGRIFRTLSQEALSRIEALEQSGVLSTLVDEVSLWPARLCGTKELPESLARQSPTGRLLEHPIIEFISHPYEWPFELLKKAALAHLRLHQRALALGYNLVDGSAYNMQFIGADPVMIDTLSLVPYAEGEPWLGYRQFCEQFLTPLLFRVDCGIPYNAWYKGAMEGLPLAEVAALLPLRKTLRPSRFLHVFLHARLQKKYSHGPADLDDGGKKLAETYRLPKKNLINLLTSLERAIAPLGVSGGKNTEWERYERDNSYKDEEARKKAAYITTFVAEAKPGTLWDLGCNAGFYSQVALEAGADKVVGFDIDHGALRAAVLRSEREKLNFLPLYFDALNPSANQGWRENERLGMAARSDADAILTLALIHHLVIGRNVPLEQVVDWLTGLAPQGIIEFVPKSDPMVVHMLASRKDIFPTYDQEHFEQCLRRRADIVTAETVSESGRRLYRFRRHDAE